jgi:hypothetical protein
MRKVMFALAIVAGAFMTAGPASAQCRYIMNDVGRFHGYLSGPCNGAAVGYAGAYPSHPNTRAMAHPTVVAPKVVPQANSRGDGCVGRCPAKCQASWQALGFRSVGACYGKWGKLNTMGIGAQCEAAIKANGLRPVSGC